MERVKDMKTASKLLNNFYSKDQKKPFAGLVISSDLFKIYFDENIDLGLIKDNLTQRQNKLKVEMNKISHKLSNKDFVNKAPKNIVDQEKTNYNNLKKDVERIAITIKGL